MQALPEGNEIVRRRQNAGESASGSRAADSSTLRIEGAVPGSNLRIEGAVPGSIDEDGPNDGGVNPDNEGGPDDEDDSPDEYDPQENNDPRELQEAETEALATRLQEAETATATERAFQEEAASIGDVDDKTTGHPKKFEPFPRHLNRVQKLIAIMWPGKHGYQPKIRLRGDDKEYKYVAYVHFEDKYLWYHMKNYTPSRNQAWKLLIGNLERACAKGFVAEPNAHKNYTFNSGGFTKEIGDIKELFRSVTKGKEIVQIDVKATGTGPSRMFQAVAVLPQREEPLKGNLKRDESKALASLKAQINEEMDLIPDTTGLKKVRKGGRVFVMASK